MSRIPPAPSAPKWKPKSTTTTTTFKSSSSPSSGPKPLRHVSNSPAHSHSKSHDDKLLLKIDLPSLDSVNKTVNKVGKSVGKVVEKTKDSTAKALKSSGDSHKGEKGGAHNNTYANAPHSTSHHSTSPRAHTSHTAPHSVSSHHTPSKSFSATPSHSHSVGNSTHLSHSAPSHYKSPSTPSYAPHSPHASHTSHSPHASHSGPHSPRKHSQSQQLAEGVKTAATTTLNAASKAADNFCATTAVDVDPHQVMSQYRIPTPKLLDRGYVSSIREGAEVLRINNVNIHLIKNRVKTAMARGGVLSCHRTNVETIAIFKFSGTSRYVFVSDIDDKPCLRPFRFHFLLTDDSYNLYMLELPRTTIKEDMHKIEMFFAYYSSFHRMHGVKREEATKVKGGGKVVDTLANGIETGSQKVAEVCVSAGEGIGKGAAKISKTYINNTKAHTGHVDQEKLAKLKSKESTDKKIEKTSEGFAKGSNAVMEGIKDGFKFVGGQAKKGGYVATEPIRDTEWYQKREAKAAQKKEKQEEEGIKTDAGVTTGVVDVFKAGWNATRTIKDGMGQGLTVGAHGVRDAKVAATRHTDGEYEAEKSKKRWNAVGHGACGVWNVMAVFSTVSTIWMSGAIYAAGGALKYDIDKADLLGGAPWKKGWLLWRGNIYSGGGYDLYWCVLSQHTLAMYRNPSEPKPEKYFKLRGFRKVEKSDKTVSARNFSFAVTRSRVTYFSTECLPDAQHQLDIWVSLLWSISEYHVPDRIQRKEKSEKKKI